MSDRLLLLHLPRALPQDELQAIQSALDAYYERGRLSVLREIAKVDGLPHLSGEKTPQGDQDPCIFCGSIFEPHAEDCLWSQAMRAIAPQDQEPTT